jgi:hypothetical protein
LDGTSGINAYEIFLNGVLVTSTVQTSYPLNNLEPGTYEVMIKAYDRAGNASTGSTTFRVLEKTVQSSVAKAMEWPLKTVLVIGAILILLVLLFSLVSGQRQKREESAGTHRGKKKSTKE